MGMAASQSRFLSLTARKSNTEYQGQQVNQARTVLANESSNLYNRLLTLDVPTPPSSNDYYNYVYTFNGGANGKQCTVEDYQWISQDQAKVTIAYETSGKVMQRTGGEIKGAVGLSSGTYSITTADDTYKLTPVDLTQTNDEQVQEIQQSMDNSGIKFIGNLYSYEVKDKNGKESTYYVSTEQNTLQNAYENKQSVQLLTYEQVQSNSIKKYTDVTAKLDYDPATGRLTKIQVTDANNSEISADAEFSLSFAKVDDEKGYNDAMNQYAYKKALYDKEVQDINAKTEGIQAKDKNLELKLKQLDTEQKAISTEIDAVQKVIEKNVESTFKTFG